jgi:hypothetical protein
LIRLAIHPGAIGVGGDLEIVESGGITARV